MGKEARVRKIDGFKRNYNDSWVNVSNVFRGPRGDRAFDCADHNNVWKIILHEMGRPDHLTCLLRNLYAGQEATVRTGHGTTDLHKTTPLQITTLVVILLENTD